MIDGHTLVIPTFNRPALLHRLVRYYTAREPTMSILVLDSSRPDIAERNATALSAHGAGVRHITVPVTTPMATKIAQGLALVETPHVSCCADDDVVFTSGLREAMEFLRGQPGYVSAHGLYLNFRVAGHDVHVTREYAGPGNEAGHPGARIFRLLQRYESLFYGVFRTAELRDIFSVVHTLPTLHYQELFQSVGALIKGKVHRFPRIYAARQSGEAAEPTRDRWQTYYWFADDPAEILEHYRAYREAVAAFYERHAGDGQLDGDAVVRVLDLAHAVYFAAQCPPEYFHSRLQAYWPGDRYVDPERIDMFERLRGRTAAPRWTPERVLGGALKVLRTARAGPAVTRLDARVRRDSGHPWRCRLPAPIRWLAGNPDFRHAYEELCRYLDAD
jgi:glycosyltransferase domain-containing protein